MVILRTILALLCSLILSQAFAQELNSAASSALTYCNSSQSVQIANGLANNMLTNPGMTKSDILVIAYNMDSGMELSCWSIWISYGQPGTLNAGPGCGCRTPITKIDVKPYVRAGDNKSAYDMKSIKIASPVGTTQLAISQGEVQPTFDTLTGLVTTQGTIKTNIQLL